MTEAQKTYLLDCMENYPVALREAVAENAGKTVPTVLNDIYHTERARCRLMVAGTDLQEKFPRLKTMPLYFEKTAPDREEAYVAEDEAALAEEISKATYGLAPLPLGAEPGIYRGEWVDGVTVSAMSPMPRAEKTVIAMARGEEAPPSKQALLDYWGTMEQVSSALVGLHDSGYSHGDSHLGNFMVEPNGAARIVDLESGRKLPCGYRGDKAILKDYERLSMEAYRVACLCPEVPDGSLRDWAMGLGKSLSSSNLDGAGKSPDQVTTLDGRSALDASLVETQDVVAVVSR